MMRWTGRAFLAAAAIALPLLAQNPAGAQEEEVLRVIPHADLKNLDPIWTTAYISRNHGYMIYDTLFAMDANMQPQPQMVESWETSDDKKTWTFTLREGLKFHDGAPVTSEDVIASLERWGVRDGMGQQLMGAVELPTPKRRRARAPSSAPRRGHMRDARQGPM
jgi:peptide/nickel transport system substrate-binding protein